MSTGECFAKRYKGTPSFDGEHPGHLFTYGPDGMYTGACKGRVGDECYTCGEDVPLNECPKSLRPCGHHCNCSWVHDHCHWCDAEFGEDAS